MFGLFRKRKAKKEAAKQLKMTEATQEEKTAPVEEKKEESKKEVVSKQAPAKKETAKQTPAKKETKNDSDSTKYHVSQNKDKKSPRFKEWRVRKQGSNKTIKYFPTQAEAIDYAKELAKNNGSSIVIHKVDGSIRKQDY